LACFVMHLFMLRAHTRRSGKGGHEDDTH
jgi:hypothetical protein